MVYQSNLFKLDVMQDRNGRGQTDYPRPPKKRGDCAPGREFRALPPDDPRALRCQAFGCRYNIIGEIGRTKSEIGAVNAMRVKVDAGNWESCTLDVVHDGPMIAREIGEALGIVKERVSQVEAEASLKFRRAFAHDSKCNDDLTEARLTASDMRRSMGISRRSSDISDRAIIRALEGGELSWLDIEAELGVTHQRIADVLNRHEAATGERPGERPRGYANTLHGRNSNLETNS